MFCDRSVRPIISVSPDAPFCTNQQFRNEDYKFFVKPFSIRILEATVLRLPVAQ